MIAEGIRLFNAQKFFEAHEALEAVWLKAQGERKILLHGLIQVAAAFHHHRCGNPLGFHSLLEKGWKKLERFGGTEEGIDLDGLRRQLQPWRDYLRHAAAGPRPKTPPLPRIRRASRASSHSGRG